VAKQGTNNLRSIDSFVIESDEKDFNRQTYAHNEATVIEELVNFEAGKSDAAKAAFDKILSRCLPCHRIIRKMVIL
jgi:hypothetical protein